MTCSTSLRRPCVLPQPLLLLAAVLSCASSLAAQVLVVNQLAPTSPSVSSGNAQIFEPGFVTSNGLMIDDFTLSGSTLLTRLDAAFTTNFSGGGLDRVQGFQISIFSSFGAVSAAGNALLGDVASIFVPVASVTSSAYNSYNTLSTVFQIPISLSLPAGTYYLGVAPQVNFLPGGLQTFMLQHFGSGGNNARLFVPGQGIMNPRNADTDFALYGQVAAVPETSTWLSGALLVVVLVWRFTARRRPVAG